MERISLREHFDELRRLDAEHRRETLVFLVLGIFASVREMQRRLDALNHAHDQAVEVQHTYVTEEKFNDAIKRSDEQVSVLTDAVSSNTGGRLAMGRLVAGAATIAVVVAAVVAVITLSLH